MPDALRPYRRLLEGWLPHARLDAPGDRLFDAYLTWKGPHGVVHYAVEEKRTLQTQDVRAVVERLKHRLGRRDRDRGVRLLLLAPFVRPEQAAVLERADVDYADLAGNAHLRGRHLFVHVEGRRPPKGQVQRTGRVYKAWVKTVLALLLRPELLTAPYRAIAEEGGVALGTVVACLADLAARGLIAERDGIRQFVDRPQLVGVWVQAYVDRLRPRLEERRFQIRAANKKELWARLRNVLAKRDVPWVITGADAAERLTHYFHVEETEIYAPTGLFDDRNLQKALVAQPAARAGNLLVIDPPAPGALHTAKRAMVPVAAHLLAYAELRYRGTPQAAEAAELLLPHVLE